VARYNLGLALAKNERHLEAVEQYKEALAIDSSDQDSHNNLGLSYEALGQMDSAAHEFFWILNRIKESANSHKHNADGLMQRGNRAEAELQLRAAAEKMKESVEPNKNIARVLHLQDMDRESLEHWRAALQESPKDSSVCLAIADLLSSSSDISIRNGSAAMVAAQQAVDLSGGKDPAALAARAASYAELGRYTEAITDAQTALELANASQQKKTLAAEIQDRLRLYQAGKPYHRRPTPRKPSSSPAPQPQIPQ
jgi:tetratricopeptide (TPR) repeat protein